ncbi:phosphatidylglycerophosphatase A family protein [Frigidibacter sp. MR17.24]|uniref:phosphatidylglycerophosphatase A family protein n=1 Tax=Frigidibacter sp. MR17.24 TaxID=3127345 RepID=UPI003012CE75
MAERETLAERLDPNQPRKLRRGPWTVPVAVVTVGGIGYLRPASGTWASAAAIVVASFLHVTGGFPLVAIATVLAIGAGFWGCHVVLKDRPGEDPSEIVIDEVAGQWLAFSAVSFGLWHAGVATLPWPAWVAPFALFRLFDIWKPGWIGRADRRGDGAGVMLDDLIAGVFAAAVAVVLAGIYHGVLAL